MTTWTDDEVGGSVWSEDEAAGTALGAATGSSLVGFVQSGTGATPRDVQAKLRDSVCLWDFLTAAELSDVVAETRLVDVTASFQRACNAAAGKTLYVPPGKYSIQTAGGVVITQRVKIVGDGLQSTWIYRDFSPSADNIGAINFNTRNGSVMEDLIFVSKTGTTGGTLASIVSTASVASSFMRWKNVEFTFEAANTYKNAFVIDGSAKTTGSLGARNIHLTDVVAFGGTEGSAYLKGVVDFSWTGYAAPGGSTSAKVTVTGDATVNSFYVNIKATILDALDLDYSQFVNFYGYVSGNFTNTSNVVDSNIFGMVDGTIQNNWLRSGISGTGQFQFPAAQNSSSNVNTLDDYEEGTWPPVLTFATPGDLNVVYSIQQGGYTKVGDKVTLTAVIRTSTFTHGTASGACTITGLPFAAKGTSNQQYIGAVMWQGITKANYTNVVCRIVESASTLTFRASGSGQSHSDVSSGDMPTGGTVDLRFTITYLAAT